MTIDVDIPESPGWWLMRGSRKLRELAPHYQELFDRLEGNGPLPHGAEGLEEAYRAFQRKARTNWCEKIVSSKHERMQLDGFRTAADDDLDGDQKAAELARSARLFPELNDALWNMLGVGVGYLMVGETTDGRIVVTSEDPRQAITFHDPATTDTRAGVKLFRDVDEGIDYGYVTVLQEDGTVRRWVARKDAPRAPAPKRGISFTEAWDWDDDRGGAEGELLACSQVPLIRFLNRRGRGEFETHTDLLDRITHQVLQRLVIIAMQAYKQRAMIGAPSEDEETGEPIDYDGLLVPGPGALWDLPDGVDIKEFSQADLTGVLSAARDDLRELIEVTATPLPAAIRDAANQSAEGAAFARESLVFAVSECNTAASEPAARALACIAEFAGDTARADHTRITPMWADPARRSLTEMADAASKAAGDLPLEERLVKIWGYTPERAKQLADAKRAEQMQQAAYLSAGLPALAPPAAAAVTADEDA